MKKLLVALSLITALTACGGGDSKAIDEPTVVTPPATGPITTDLTQAELEVKFNLPPEPEKFLNSSTILGIDSNGVRGRDDVERELTFKLYKDLDILNYFFNASENSRSLTKLSQSIKDGVDGSKEEFSKLFQDKLDTQLCYLKKYGSEFTINVSVYEDLQFNTDERFTDYYISEGYVSNVKFNDLNSIDCQKKFDFINSK